MLACLRWQQWRLRAVHASLSLTFFFPASCAARQPRCVACGVAPGALAAPPDGPCGQRPPRRRLPQRRAPGGARGPPAALWAGLRGHLWAQGGRAGGRGWQEGATEVCALPCLPVYNLALLLPSLPPLPCSPTAPAETASSRPALPCLPHPHPRPPPHSHPAQLVAYEVTKLSPTEFEQRVVGHNISGLAGHRKPSWNRWVGGVGAGGGGGGGPGGGGGGAERGQRRGGGRWRPGPASH